MEKNKAVLRRTEETEQGSCILRHGKGKASLVKETFQKQK